MVNPNTGEIEQDGTRALALIEGSTVSVLPSDAQVDEGLRRAGHLASRMAELIEQKHLYQVIGKKKHVLVEAWETIIGLDRATPRVDAVDNIEENGLLVAYRATVSIWKDGAEVSNGIMECGLEDEFVTQRATGRGKNRAAQSAAQTWALAKAARMRYAWVIVMAGYAPTPAEEMPPEGYTRGANPSTPRVTQAQLDTLVELVKRLGWTKSRIADWFNEQFGRGPREITKVQGTTAIQQLTALLHPVEPAEETEIYFAGIEEPGEDASPQTYADLYKLAGQFEMTKEDVWAYLGVTDDSQIGDLGLAWAMIQESQH